MSKAYRFSLTTPQGKSEAEANSLTSLVRSFSFELTNAVVSQVAPESDSILDVFAKRVLAFYRSSHTRKRNPVQSPIVMAGFELDLIKCYLRGMTHKQTVKWLRDNGCFNTSVSAIGRYWAKLRKLGISHGVCRVAGTNT